MEALIVHVVFNTATDTYKPGNNNVREKIETTLILFSPCPDLRQARDISIAHLVRLRIYPDNGVTICLGRLKHLWHMGLSEKNLAPPEKKVYTVGGFSLVCQGWLPVTFKIGKRTTKQALYICSKVQVIYFSKATCIDVSILPPCVPKPITLPPLLTSIAVHPYSQHHKIDPPGNKHKFDYPQTPLYPPTSENLKKTKKKKKKNGCRTNLPS